MFKYKLPNYSFYQEFKANESIYVYIVNLINVK